jgi:NADP-dependent 3-hydroxy acid dehydrogenase YdfG
VGVSVLDVRSRESWAEAWQACEEGMGVPSVLLNIAGVKGEEQWDTLYDVNVVSAFLV